jgi:Arc/MetJ family transcription regulator
MRTSINIDDKLLEKASRLIGVKEKTSLVRLGLEALIARESSKRLAKFGGSENNLRSIPGRKYAYAQLWSLLTHQFGLPICDKATSGLKSC